jgi:hypothetical protein
MTKLAICVPARDTVHAGFALGLTRVVEQLVKTNITHEVLFNLGTVLPDQRNTLIKDAMRINATHILWLDSDMHVPASTAHRLLSHDVEIVAAAYSTRIPPYQSVAFTNKEDFDKRLTETQGLHSVWAVGMGCMLVDMEVYQYLGQPWHNYSYNQSTESLTGEDIYFCDNANSAGIPVHVDATLSQELVHYGTKSFKLGN